MCREGEGGGGEWRGRGEGKKQVTFDGVRGGGAGETAAAVTVQYPSYRYRTARMKLLGFTLNQIVRRVTQNLCDNLLRSYPSQ